MILLATTDIMPKISLKSSSMRWILPAEYSANSCMIEGSFGHGAPYLSEE